MPKRRGGRLAQRTPCVPQKAVLKTQVTRYNIAFYDAHKLRGAKLMDIYELGIATPIHRTAYAALKPYAKGTGR